MTDKQAINGRNQLRWRCRRGMQELDLLLFYYIDNHYDQAAAAEQQAFADMLEWPDPVLYAFLCATPPPTEHQTDKPHAAHIVRLIHARHQTKVLQ